MFFCIFSIHKYVYISGNCRAVTCTHVKLAMLLHGFRAIPCNGPRRACRAGPCCCAARAQRAVHFRFVRVAVRWILL